MMLLSSVSGGRSNNTWEFAVEDIHGKMSVVKNPM